jgi:hypothetical protein
MSLVSNVQNLSIQGVNGVVASSSTTRTQTTATSVYLGQPRSVEPNLLIYVGIGAVALLVAVLYRRFKRNKKDEYYVETTPVNDRLSQIIALGLLALTMILIMNIPKYLPAVLHVNSLPSHPDLVPVLTIVGLLAVVVGSILGVSTLLQAGKLFSTHAEPVASDLTQHVDEFKQIIDETRYFLETGSDFRSTVIQCYKALCMLLQEKGVPQQANLTPREFERVTVAKLGIARVSIHRLTALFEKARYSSEMVSSEEAANAQESLDGVSLELGRLKEALLDNAADAESRVILHA